MTQEPAARTVRDTAPRIAVIGGGPAGLMAAEVAAGGGVRVDVYDAMPSVGRKFLLAGVGGMNITHSEPAARFTKRYGARGEEIASLLAGFDADALRTWVHGLGIETFTGSSGRVFPTDMKAAPLLRAWLHRLRESGVVFHRRHRFLGWETGGALRFLTPAGETTARADAVVLALGGGSWARLGSDGAWVPWLAAMGVGVAPLRPSNCGFNVEWSMHFRERFAGTPLKSVVAAFTATDGVTHRREGECVVTAAGLEGSLVYALSAPLRDSLTEHGVTLYLDLAPARDAARLAADLARPRGRDSMSNHLRKRAGLDGVKVALLRELLPPAAFADMSTLAAAIKALPVHLLSPRPLDEAISTAGGVRFESLDGRLMLKAVPGVFCAGEMLDWEAPTGGYLLTACFASGHAASRGALAWLRAS